MKLFSMCPIVFFIIFDYIQSKSVILTVMKFLSNNSNLYIKKPIAFAIGFLVSFGFSILF